MTLITAGSTGFALGVGDVGAALVLGVCCALFIFVLLGPDFAFLKDQPKN